MFSFAYPKLLLLLLLSACFRGALCTGKICPSRNLKKFGHLKVLAPLMPEVSPYKPPIKITLEMMALALIVIAFARPRVA